MRPAWASADRAGLSHPAPVSDNSRPVDSRWTAPAPSVDDAERLRRDVDDAVWRTPVVDLHTHLFPPDFGALSLRGVDELVTYHYLVAEYFRSVPASPAGFWNLTKRDQADRIWDALFVQRTPLSVAARGVVNVLVAFGLDPSARDLAEARAHFAAERPERHVERVFALANVVEVVMTNDPFDPGEVAYWERGVARHPRFHAALRLDRLLADAAPAAADSRRFLAMWIDRSRPLYLAVSLGPEFAYGDDSACTRALRDVILPTAVDHDLPVALMIGVERGVNPELRSAGDGVGRADIRAVERVCGENPDVRFLVTMLSRENQHELCVAARAFANLTPFGCWWYLNTPSLVTEITLERLELLGTSFVAQHSDARVLEQLVYKWDHARRAVADALFAAYLELARDGHRATPDEIGRDVERLFAGTARAVTRLGTPGVTA